MNPIGLRHRMTFGAEKSGVEEKTVGLEITLTA